ncbi:Aspartic peptidase [Parasponia andersonii]|uniref:Aspartic peptidase n=1 Tax=Parasponia andersonii TaxID=3476 RepID=A0A2P5DH74_PARAD|nr:Aspartic peptidase [Parasponia andersonii]
MMNSLGSFSSSYPFFIFFLLFAINGLILISADNDEISGSTRLELIHRNSLKLSGKVGFDIRPKTQMENFKQLHHRDVLRRQNMVSRRRKTIETAASVSMPMHSGSDFGTGEYFVEAVVGTPGQKFLLVADTGSELTWVKCKYDNCGRRPECLNKPLDKTVFNADHSTSFQTVPCSSQTCKSELSDLFSLARCPTNASPCAYDYRYMEGSAALGIFAHETVSVDLTNGVKRKLGNVLIGCTQTVQDDQGSFKGADGVLGLGSGKHTFTARIAEDFGGKFSYCLVDHLSPMKQSSYIVFGQNRVQTPLSGSIQQTKLVLGGAYGSNYGVKVSGISVGGSLLDIPFRVWDENLGGGTILDSGTSLTFLAEPAYKAVTAAFDKFLSTQEKLPADGGPFEFCFNSAKYAESLVPRVKIQFADGAVFEPPVKSYILDVAPQTLCLGFVAGSWPGISVIGNIMQQNHLWEFDVEKSTLSFAASSCT